MCVAIMVQEMNEGQWRFLALPWDEEAVIADAVANFNAPWQQPNNEKCMRAARGSQIEGHCSYSITGFGVAASVRSSVWPPRS